MYLNYMFYKYGAESAGEVLLNETLTFVIHMLVKTVQGLLDQVVHFSHVDHLVKSCYPTKSVPIKNETPLGMTSRL